jgi:hypothetical protein
METFLKKLLIGSLFFPVCVLGQHAFLNEGKIVIQMNPENPEGVSLFVLGDAEFREKPEVLLDGDFQLSGDFISNVNLGNIFTSTSTGTTRFHGTQLQTIRGTGNKSTEYIYFPKLGIQNPGGVKLESNMGISVDELNLFTGKFILGSTVEGRRETSVAHLLAGSVTGYDYTNEKVIEIELALNDPSEENREQKFMGFSLPASRMYADYFCFNYLTAPDPVGFFGTSGRTITDPLYELEPGRGYFIGQNVFESDTPEKGWMNDKLVINRNAMLGNPSCFRTPGDAEERIITEDVHLTLKPGFNYLGNPYTCPLDLGLLLQENDGTDFWNITRGTDNEDLHPAVWVYMNGISEVIDSDNLQFRISGTFLVNQEVGSLVEANEVSPMQLFIVWANNPSTITIPASCRTHGTGPFLRSERQVTDELLLQATDLSSQNFDRCSIALRPDASMQSDDPFDAYKLFNHTKGVCQLYTRSSEGHDMAVNVVNSSMESISLHFLPGSESTDIRIEASRLESIESIEEVWLEDRKLSIWVNLKEIPLYTFHSDPSDNPERFSLHFKEITDEETIILSEPLIAQTIDR